MAEFISSLVSKVLNYSVVVIVRHAGYALWSDGYMKGLQDGVRKIKNTREGIQHRIDEAETTEEYRVEPLVSSWMVQADAFIEEGEKLISRRKNAYRCVGLVANPKIRYVLGRKAKHGLDDIAAHLKDKEFDRITYRPSPSEGIGTASSSKGDTMALKSRHLMLENIMKSLGDDTVDRIGVYGDGGVGKTTLLHQVEIEARLSKDFDEVVTGVVSQNPDFGKIRAKIQNVVERVKLKAMKDEEDNDHKVGFPMDNGGKANVKKRGVLIILDDLWRGFDSEKIGAGEKDDRIKVKLLMTSRYRSVLVDEMDCRENFHLKVLNEKEAWKLFESIVGNKDLSLKTTGEELVKKCQGLPLLIVAMGKQLEKTDSPKDWEGALEQLQGSDIVQKALELSFKQLDDRHLLLLRIISSLDGRGGVWDEALVRYVVGLGLFARNDNTVEATRDGTMALLNGLRADSLLLDCDDNCVKVHDLVRDAVISIADRDQHALVLRNGKDLKDSEMKLHESKAIFFPYPDINKLSSVWECRELEVLVALAEKDHLMEISDFFFAFMPKLKVLGLSHTRVKPLPSSMRYLTNLQTLSLDYCDLEDVSIVGELRHLQALSFIGSDITMLPKEVSQLTELRLLDLSHCSKLEVIERGALKGLDSLEELYMKESFVRWVAGRDEHENNCSLAELNKMTQLSNLDILIPDVNVLSKDLPFGKLVKYRIHIGDTWKWSGEYKASRTLKLKLQCNWILSEEWFQLTLQRVEHLHLCGWNGKRRSVHELSLKGFKELKHLCVENSPAANYIVRSSEWLDESAFTILESLLLEDLVNLERICHGLLRKDSFTRLREVIVHRCNKLTDLFPVSLARGLHELEKIEVIDCGIMEKVIVAEIPEENDEDRVDDGETTASGNPIKLSLVQGLVSVNGLTPCCFTSKKAVEDESREDDKDKIVEETTRCCIVGTSAPKQPRSTRKKVVEDDYVNLPRLRHLTLWGLPNITTFFSKENSILSISTGDPQGNPAAFFDDRRVSLPCLETLKLIELPQLIALWVIHSSVELGKLQSLEVGKCRNLSKAMDSSLVKKLKSLESLVISQCESIVEVFDLQGLDVAGGDAEILPQLRKLKLGLLNSMRSVWTKCPQVIMGFRNLMSIMVWDCDDLRYLFSWSMAKALEKLTEIEIYECKGMEAAVILEEGEKTEDVVEFPSLKVLNIGGCPKMKSFLLNSHDNREPEEMEAMRSLKMKLLCCGKQEDDQLSGPADKPEDEDTSDTAAFFNEKVLLPSLEKLQLSYLRQLKKIWHSKLPKGSFCQLESLTVESCRDLPVVFSSTMTKRLNKLKRIMLGDCGSLEMLFEPVSMDSDKNLKWVGLPQLKELDLKLLPELKHVVASDSNLVVGLPSLTKIQVMGCEELINLFPTTTATSLSKLEEVHVRLCDNMREVIAEEEGAGVSSINEMVFPHLRSLQLNELRSLICFCSANFTLDFPSLANMSIIRCADMMAFVQISSEHMESQAFFNEKVELPNLVHLTIRDNAESEELWHENVPVRSFCKLKDLDVSKCARLRRVIPSFMEKRLQSLEVLTIRYCGSLEELNARDGSNSSDIINHLTELVLTDLPSLTSIWKNDSLSSFSVHNLTLLEVSECGSLAWLFTTSQAKCLERLQRLVIDECHSMEHVIVHGNGRESADGIIFPHLTSLKLSDLPMLSSFYEETHTSEPSSPGTLFSAEKHTFPSLETLQIHECHGLKALFTSGTAKLLVQLTNMTITECDALTEVVVRGMSNGRDETISFDELKELRLTKLRSITHFCSGDFALKFPSLETLTVSQCPLMKIFCQGDLSAPKLDKVRTGTDDWIWESDLNGSITRIYNKKEGFVDIKRLKLSASPLWEDLWLNNHPPKFFTKLETLIVEDCGFVSKAVIPSDKLPILGNLQLLEIRDCGAVERVFDSPREVSKYSLSDLQKIYLTNLPVLTLVIPDNLGRVFKFLFLETLEIDNCGSLRTILNPTTALGLKWLRKIKISNCEMLEEVITGENEEDQTPEPIRLPWLRFITLKSLPMLVGFCPGSRSLDCWELEDITIRDCPKMKTFTSPLVVKKLSDIDDDEEDRSRGTSSKLKGGVQVHDEPFFNEKVLFSYMKALALSRMDSLSIIWHDQFAEESFGKLMSMKIEHCAKLLKVFPTKSVERFVQLKRLTISHCDSLEEVFDLSDMSVTRQVRSRGPEGRGDGEIREEDDNNDVTTAMSLTELSLSHLPELKSICNAEIEGTISFPDLKPVRVIECPKLESLQGFPFVTEPHICASAEVESNLPDHFRFG